MKNFTHQPSISDSNVFTGVQFSEIDNMNIILRSEGVSKVSSSYLLIGGGMNFIYGKHYVHFKGHGALNDPEKDLNNFRTSAWGFGGGITYGYGFGLSQFRLVPYVGLTNDELIIEIEELPIANSNIQTQIQNQNITKLHNEVFSAVIGLRILIPTDMETMFAGFDFGYHIPYRREWSNGDFSTTNTPNLNVGGFTLGIEILFTTDNNSW